LREQHDMPLWNGESGENTNEWYANAVTLLEKNGIGWAWWPLKKMGSNNPLEIKDGVEYRRLSAYLRGEGRKPPAKVAFTALMQLAADSRFERNVYHQDVVDALLGARNAIRR
jgi:endoglucanase